MSKVKDFKNNYISCDNGKYTEDYDSIEKVLNDFCKDFLYMPEQRSKEWLALRLDSFGGSEVATLVGRNTYMNVEKLIKQKIGITKFNGNTATRWGNLFEPITQKWTEMIFHMKKPIFELGSVTGPIKGLRYSPDGLGVVKLSYENGTPELFIILFEFKAPFSAMPQGKIPDHYLCQVLTGMMNIPVADYIIFVSNYYRKCALADLDFHNKYDTTFHKGDLTRTKQKAMKKIMGDSGPLSFGAIFLYHCEREEFDDYINDPLSGLSDSKYNDDDEEIFSNDFTDFGKSDTGIFSRLMYLYDNKRIKAKYYPIILNYEEINSMDVTYSFDIKHEEKQEEPLIVVKKQMEDFHEYCEKHNYSPAGVIPWKLMMTEVYMEERDEDWQEEIEGDVEDALGLLRKFRSADDPKEACDDYYAAKPKKDKDGSVASMMAIMDLK